MTLSSDSRLAHTRTFLRYGYVPEPRWDVLQLFADDEFLALKHEFASRSRQDLIAEANRAADEAFEEAFTGISGDVVIPVSGGRDSRFILCMADAFGLRDRVLAITWGVPGGLDYEISSKVSSRIGVRHERIDTTRTPIGFSDLKQAFDNGAHWTDLQLAHFNQAWRTVAPAATAIIGYLGGPPVGCHYQPGHELRDFPAAVASFEAINRRWDFGAPAVGGVGHNEFLDPSRVSFPEQLDLVYRQEGYLRRIVAPPRLAPRTPFAHPRWMRTMYAMPGACRTGGNLFTELLMERFPRAFAIGASGAYGLRADAAPLRRLAARRALRLAHIGVNLFRARKFATFDKYGDERDLLAALAPDSMAPREYASALSRGIASNSRENAAHARLRAMLICNLACLDDAGVATEAFAA